MSLRVPSNIVPLGNFPVTEDHFVKGGLRVAASLADLQELTTALSNVLKPGSLALTVAEKKLWVWTLTGVSSNSGVWAPFVLSTSNLPDIPNSKLEATISAWFRVVPTWADLVDIPLGNLKEGMLALVLLTNELWEFNKGIGQWTRYRLPLANLPLIPDSKLVSAGAGGSGASALMIAANKDDLNAYINPDLPHGTMGLTLNTRELWTFNTNTNVWNRYILPLVCIPQIPNSKLESPALAGPPGPPGTPGFSYYTETLYGEVPGDPMLNGDGDIMIVLLKEI